MRSRLSGGIATLAQVLVSISSSWWRRFVVVGPVELTAIDRSTSGVGHVADVRPATLECSFLDGMVRPWASTFVQAATPVAAIAISILITLDMSDWQTAKTEMQQ
jgi:hypothetical protein